MLTECQRCGKKIYNGEVCNYCGRIIGEECIKASKYVKRKDISKLVICKDCWNNTTLRKMYKRGEPKFTFNL